MYVHNTPFNPAGQTPQLGQTGGAAQPAGGGMGGGAPMNQSAMNSFNQMLTGSPAPGGLGMSGGAPGLGLGGGAPMPGAPGFGPPQQQMSAAVMPPMQGTPGLQLQDQIQAMQQQQAQYLGPTNPQLQLAQNQLQNFQGMQRQQELMSQMPGTFRPKSLLQGMTPAQQAGYENNLQQNLQALQSQQAQQSQYAHQAALDYGRQLQAQNAQPQYTAEQRALQDQYGIHPVNAAPTQQPPALSRTQQLGMDARAQAELNRQNIATMQQNMGPRSDAPMYTPPASFAQPIQAQPVQAQPVMPRPVGNKAASDFSDPRRQMQYQSPRPSMPQRPQMSQSGSFGGRPFGGGLGGGLGALNANQQALMQRFGRTGG